MGLASLLEVKSRFNPVICMGHSKPVPDMHYSKITPDGYFLVSACLDGKAMIREGETGDWIGSFIGHKGAVWSTDINADATLLATASADFTVRVWDAVRGKSLREYEHNHIVKRAVFSTDSKFLYTGGKEKKIRVFDVNSDSVEPVHVVVGAHGDTINHIIPVRPNLVVSAADEESVAKIWDPSKQWTQVGELKTEAPVTHLSLSGDGTTLTASAGSKVYFWTVPTDETSSVFTLVKTVDVSATAGPKPIKCVAYQPSTESYPNGRFVLGNIESLYVRVFDYTTEKELACTQGHHAEVVSVDWNPSGDTYASASVDGTIRLWDQWSAKKLAATAAAAAAVRIVLKTVSACCADLY